MLTGSRDNKCVFGYSKQIWVYDPPPTKESMLLLSVRGSTELYKDQSKARSQIPLVMYIFLYNLHFNTGLLVNEKTPNFKLIQGWHDLFAHANLAPSAATHCSSFYQQRIQLSLLILCFLSMSTERRLNIFTFSAF